MDELESSGSWFGSLVHPTLRLAKASCCVSVVTAQEWSIGAMLVTKCTLRSESQGPRLLYCLGPPFPGMAMKCQQERGKAEQSVLMEH